ncbi:MAG: TlpA family protein disulfide reductase [Breznakibacter sp.]
MDWSITSLEGETVRLQFPSGKPALINFWATWCPPCIAELPALQRLYDQYQGKVDFYFISDEDPQTLKAFLEKKGYTIPVYTIGQNVEGKLHSRSIPATFLIAPNGRLIMNKTGAAKWDGNKVKKTINELLE